MENSNGIAGEPARPVVDIDYIKSLLPQEGVASLNIVQILDIVQSFYCRTIQTRGVCPMNCRGRCTDEIIDLFRLEGVRDPKAILIWRSKDHAAKIIEKLIEEQKHFPSVSSSAYGLSCDGNSAGRTSESPQAPQTEQDVYDSLFPKRGPEENIFLLLLKDYE
jgi:hypothetical protein